MKALPILFAVLALLAPLLPTLPAQTLTHVSPAAFATASGNGNYFPFGGTLEPWWRYQQIHTDVPATFGLITGLAWRRSNASSAYPACWYDLQVLMSTAATTPTTMSGTFAANHGPDLLGTVFGSGGPGSFLRLSWPATVAPPTQPAPFVYAIPFLRPFPYRKQPVCWEVRIRGRSTASTPLYYFDFTGRTVSPVLSRAKWSSTQAVQLRLAGAVLGLPACRASDQTAGGSLGQNSSLAGGIWTLTLTGLLLKKASTAVYVLGDTTTAWGSIPLPFALPGTPGCHLLTRPLVVGPPVVTNSGGSCTSAPLTFPDIPTLAGATFHAQWLYLDPPAPLGARTTQGLSLTFPPHGFAATAQGVYAQQGLITRFSGR